MMFTYSLYPDNWSDLAIAVKQEAKWCCQKCGLQCIPPGEKTSHLCSKKDLSEYLRTQKRKNLKLAFTAKAFTQRSLPP
jgi:hypothetical protein